MTEEQCFLFDTFGYLIIPNALDNDQVSKLRKTLRYPVEQWDPLVPSKGVLHWHKIWRDLLDVDTLSPILEELIGDPILMTTRKTNDDDDKHFLPLPTFRLDHINIHTHIDNNFKGGILHGGPLGDTNGMFRYHDGYFSNGLISVSFELYDTYQNNGGFCCIPGTHKSNIKLPDIWKDLSKGVASWVKRIPAKPGEAIIFTEALIHGTLPWDVDSKRSTVFYKYSPHSSSWSSEYFDPEDFRKYRDMDDRKLSILEPPNARYKGRLSKPKQMDQA